MKQRFAVVVGQPGGAPYLARLMNEHSQHWRFKAYSSTRAGTIQAAIAAQSCDAVVSFGGPAPNAALAEVARARGIPIVTIWDGSDVVDAKANPTALQAVRIENYTHVSDAPWLVDELRVLGIEAAYVPVTAVKPGPAPRPLPDQFAVLTYLPGLRREFYGRDAVYRLARAMPSVPFRVIGEGPKDPLAPPNVRFYGGVSDTTALLDASTVLLRIPQHDGKSMLVLEALARERHVVWNYEFPFVHTAKAEDDVLATLRELQDKQEAGTLASNCQGRTYVLEQFGRDRIARAFEHVLDEAARPLRESAEHAKLKVAVSGLPLFASQVVESARQYVPECVVRVMPATTRLQVLTGLRTLAENDVWYIIGAPRQDRFLKFAAKVLRKPQVLHWVGSDILHLANGTLGKTLNAPAYKHLAEVNWTQDELSSLGVNAEIAPLPVRYHANCAPPPLPDVFTMLLYVPLNRAEAYGAGEFVRLMRALKGEPVRYLIVGGGELEVPPGVDFENLRWRADLREAYERSTVLVRFTQRDGLSLMVLEALAFGRHVVWTQPFAAAEQVQTYEDLERVIRELLEKHKRGRLTTNACGREYVLNEYSADRTIRRLADAWSDCVTQSRMRALTGNQPVSYTRSR